MFVSMPLSLSLRARETIAERRADDGIDEVGEDVAAFDIHFHGRGALQRPRRYFRAALAGMEDH